MATRACGQCGSAMPEQAKFCGSCGAVSEPGPATDRAPPPSAGAAAGAAADPSAQANAFLNPARTMMEFAAPEVSTPPAAPPPAQAELKPTRATQIMIPPEPTLRSADASASTARSEHAGRGAPPDAGKKTMMGISAADLMEPPHVPAATSDRADPASSGVSSTVPDARDSGASVAQAQPRPHAEANTHGSDKRTMMGVAIPGIAPTNAGQPPAHSGVPMNARSGTMMGVAVPGVAPLNEPRAPAFSPAQPQPRPRNAAPPVDIVPAPPPLADMGPAPAAPIIARKKGGFPLAAVAIIAAILLVGGGVVIALVLLKGAPPLSAEARADAKGKEILHLTCEGCKDDTVAELNGAKATFKGGEADLPVLVALRVGDNPLVIRMNRPGVGRDETVKLVVPVAFRIFPDLTTLDAPRPAITVRVEALAGTEVRVEDKPVTLDASGVGAYAVDLTSATDGPSDKSTEIEKQIAYVVTPPNGAPPQTGTIYSKFTVVPLAVDAPGVRAVVDSRSFVVWGRVSTRSAVTVNGKPVTVTADPGEPARGRFEATVDASGVGDVKFEVRASSPSYAPRTIRRSVKRVEKLEAEAKALEASSPLGYDAIMAELAQTPPKSGQLTVVEGEVVSSKVDGHRTYLGVDDKRGCAKPPCRTRVVLTHQETLAAGETIRAYGRVTGPFPTSDGKSVPDVEADFVVKGKPPR